MTTSDGNRLSVRVELVFTLYSFYAIIKYEHGAQTAKAVLIGGDIVIESLKKLGEAVLKVAGVAAVIWFCLLCSGVAGASPLPPETTVIVGGNTCSDAVVKGVGVADVDGAYALRYVYDQGSFGEKYLSEPITVPRLLNAGDEILITGPWLTPGENGGTVTLTRTQFDDGATIERLATTARDVIRPTLAECTDRGEEMPDYYPENILLDQRAHQPS